MSALKINFAPKSLWRAALELGPFLGVAALTALSLGAGLFWVLAVLVARQDDMTTKQAAQDKQVQTLRAVAPQPAAPEPSATQIVAVNEAIRRLNLPWPELFAALETATTAGPVALLSIETDTLRNTLRGVAEAKGSDDMIAYIERLELTPPFTAARLLQHERAEQDPDKPFRFQFEVRWTRVSQ